MYEKLDFYEKKLTVINLQLFAGEGDDKTEKATPRKKQRAREKGQVFQSREITSAIILLAAFLTLKVCKNFMVREIELFTIRAVTEYPFMEDIFSTGMISKVFADIIIVMVKVAMPVLLAAALAGIICSYAQVGFIFSTETILFKFDRINPLSGFRRIFSARSIIELIKAIIKISLVVYIAYSFIKGESVNVLKSMSFDITSVAVYVVDTSLNLAIRMCVALIALGLLDYGYQWWDYERSLRMSKLEIKEEFKETEGNPEVKSRIRQIQRQMSMRRMMQEVPKADVVITNPTHYAVALKYDAEVADAPVVTAKGKDYIAMRIRETARENNVEIVENKPLAQSLYKTVEVGEKIPEELYQAVAEILAFVYGLQGKDV